MKMNFTMVALLHNVAKGSWHPILLKSVKMRGNYGLSRVKSVAHHIEGFPTREAAEGWVTTRRPVRECSFIERKGSSEVARACQW